MTRTARSPQNPLRIQGPWHNEVSSVDPKAKEDLARDLQQARGAFERLHKILEKLKPSNRFSEYDTPAWQYKLAHNQGKLEAFEYVQSLIDLYKD